ncbi:MAG: adenylate kinase-like [Wigglesworthia glossinidia]|nr:adenylate kinase-like [Wigglesworthia glossinidia]
MKIIFIGPPGSGKGTQSEIISKKYDIPKISSGDLLRNQNKNENQILMQKGYLIDDHIITKMILKRLNNKDCLNGFILDGFPRTLCQAKYIRHICIDFIFDLYIPEKLILPRISGRLIHKISGKIYHINDTFQSNFKLNEKNHMLKKRTDDCNNTLKIRIQEYNKNYVLLHDFYEQQTLKKKLKYHIIDASLTIDQIHENINKILINN